MKSGDEEKSRNEGKEQRDMSEQSDVCAPVRSSAARFSGALLVGALLR